MLTDKKREIMIRFRVLLFDSISIGSSISLFGFFMDRRVKFSLEKDNSGGEQGRETDTTSNCEKRSFIV